MGLWYPKDIAMALTAYADANHAGCQDTRKSTSGSAQVFIIPVCYEIAILDSSLPLDILDSVPVKARLAIGKSNLLMDLQKMQKNPIFRISVDQLQNTNFFSAFTVSADVNLDADLLHSALGITAKDFAYPFMEPRAGDLVIDFVDNLG
ncbi:hypothetical protein Tco_0744530 [Tanacetum coccineum]